MSSTAESAGFPAIDSSGLRFAYVNTSNGTNNVCMVAEASGTTLTRNTLAQRCARARLSANGRAAVFLTKEPLVPAADPQADAGLDLYLRFLP